MTRIAVIGGGRIGEALISGLLHSGYASKDLVVAERVAARADELAREYPIRVTDSPSDAAEGADIVVVAVKPTDVDKVLTELTETDSENDQIYVSLAAGIPTTVYENSLPAGAPVVRVMPNTPMLVGQGASALAPGRYVKGEHLERVRELLSSVGTVSVVSESLIDAVTALSGSGPAYFFLVAEAMIDAAVNLGLPRGTATDLVAQTMAGSAAMLAVEGEHAPDLRAAVTSPGGTTAAAVRVLERAGVRGAFYDALEAAARRSAELGAPTDKSSVD